MGTTEIRWTPAPRERPVIDSTQGRNVIYQGPGVATSITDIKNHRPLGMEQDNQASIFLAPGEVMVLEVAIKEGAK